MLACKINKVDLTVVTVLMVFTADLDAGFASSPALLSLHEAVLSGIITELLGDALRTQYITLQSTAAALQARAKEAALSAENLCAIVHEENVAAYRVSDQYSNLKLIAKRLDVEQRDQLKVFDAITNQEITAAAQLTALRSQENEMQSCYVPQELDVQRAVILEEQPGLQSEIAALRGERARYESATSATTTECTRLRATLSALMMRMNSTEAAVNLLATEAAATRIRGGHHEDGMLNSDSLATATLRSRLRAATALSTQLERDAAAADVHLAAQQRALSAANKSVRALERKVKQRRARLAARESVLAGAEAVLSDERSLHRDLLERRAEYASDAMRCAAARRSTEAMRAARSAAYGAYLVGKSLHAVDVHNPSLMTNVWPGVVLHFIYVVHTVKHHPHLF